MSNIMSTSVRTPLDMWVPMTNDRGSLMVEPEATTEPEPGSILLTEGSHGTAWQRHFTDGKWHSTRGGAAKTWADLIQKRNVVLVYDAAVREPGREGMA